MKTTRRTQNTYVGGLGCLKQVIGFGTFTFLFWSAQPCQCVCHVPYSRSYAAKAYDDVSAMEEVFRATEGLRSVSSGEVNKWLSTGCIMRSNPCTEHCGSVMSVCLCIYVHRVMLYIY